MSAGLTMISIVVLNEQCVASSDWFRFEHKSEKVKTVNVTSAVNNEWIKNTEDG